MSIERESFEMEHMYISYDQMYLYMILSESRKKLVSQKPKRTRPCFVLL